MAPPTSQPDPTDAQIDTNSRTALASTKANIRYLYSPTTNSSLVSSRKTRAFLRVLRSATIFAFWRLVRYAKYVAIGSLVATVGAGVLGTFVSGAGFVLAPTGVLGTVGAAVIWGVGRFAARRVKGRWERGRGYGEVEERRDEGLRRNAELRARGPDAVPW